MWTCLHSWLTVGMVYCSNNICLKVLCLCVLDVSCILQAKFNVFAKTKVLWPHPIWLALTVVHKDKLVAICGHKNNMSPDLSLCCCFIDLWCIYFHCFLRMKPHWPTFGWVIANKCSPAKYCSTLHFLNRWQIFCQADFWEHKCLYNYAKYI